MARLLLTVWTILLLASCRQSSVLTEKEKKDIIYSVGRMMDNYHGDIRKSGLTAELKYLDNSPDCLWVPPGYAETISYDSVVNILKQNASNYKHIDNSFDKLKVIPLTKELATYTGQLHSVMTDTNNKQATFSLIETGL